MSQALYRKWRPARFDQVVGQEHVTQTLQNAVAAGRIGHAYLFSGPRGTGKTTIARLLAKAANCLAENLAQRPCNECGPCLAVAEGRFLDLIEIDAASNTGVDDIRDLRDKINFAPSEGRFKVYIIDEVHMLSTAAFNALLKTLEEPPPHAIFVLATTEEHKVLLTIKSRCQQFNFRLLTTQEISGRLQWLAEQEHLLVESQAVIMIAQQGAGSLRDAESLLDQLVAAPGDTITLKRAQTVLGTASTTDVTTLTDAWLAGDGSAGLTVIHQALGSGADARQFSRQMVAYLRQLLLLRTAGGDMPLDATEEQKEVMNRQAMQADRRLLIDAVKRFNEAATTSSASWQPQLPLELAFIDLLPEEPVGTPYRVVHGSTAAGTVVQEPRAVVQEETLAQSTEPVSLVKETLREAESKPPSSEEVESSVQAEAEPIMQAEGDVETEPETGPDARPVLSLDWVTTNWPNLRELLGRKDKSLPALLASCKPLAVEGYELILGFDYPLLREKFDKRVGTKETVADTLSDLLGAKCTLRTVITNQYRPAVTSERVKKEDFAALAQELGGIVNEE